MAVATKERPILFSAPMVRAILEGRKTQTRRVVKPQPPEHAIEVFDWRRPDIAESVKANEGCYYNDMDGLHFHCKCPYGQPGDRLWVRETWAPKNWNTSECRTAGCPDAAIHPSEVMFGEKTRAIYKASYREELGVVKWKPSIHMPRWASRITLEITDVRVERLQDISERDACAEGAQCAGFPASLTNRGAFANLWEKINGDGSWDANPWVWVVGFKLATE